MDAVLALTWKAMESCLTVITTLRFRRYFSRLSVAISGLNQLISVSLRAEGMGSVPTDIVLIAKPWS